MSKMERFLRRFEKERKEKPEGYTDEEKLRIIKKFTSNIPPQPFEIPEGLPFDIELMRQKERLVSFGFHKRLKLTEQEYRNSLPKFISQPEAFRRRLDIPVLVDPRVLLRLQYKLAGISYDFDKNKTVKVEDWEGDPKGYKTPNSPYIAWVRLHEGKNYMARTAANTRETLAFDERGGTVFDCAAFGIAHPEILGAEGIILPGTTIDYSKAKASMKDRAINSMFPGFSVVQASRKEYAAIFHKSWKSVDPISLNWSFPRFFSMVCGRQQLS